MKIKLDLTKTLEQNASEYFEKAKKARKKLAGAEEAHKRMTEKAEKHAEKVREKEAEINLKPPEKHWYHKYRHSTTRNGHLLVAGQNAGANETLVKHHTEQEDIVFHTDMAGSPFTILKPQGEIKPEDLEDAAQFTAAYSKAWSKGMASLEVFYVKPEQVTKEAQAGEFLPKGAFMIRGTTTYLSPPIQLSIGVIEREGFVPEVFVGSKESCEQHANSYATIIPGKEKTSDIAKQLQKRFGGLLDSYVKAIPAGGTTFSKQ